MDGSHSEYAWLDGQIVPWDEARIHVRTEAIMRGSTVFEGLRAYWNSDQEQLYVFRMPEHMRRLAQSMKMMRMTLPYPVDVISKAMLELLVVNRVREDAHTRPTVYLGEGKPFGYLPDEIRCGAFITAMPSPTPAGVWDGISACVSTWRRLPDIVMPPRIKAGANYQNSRMAAVEARVNGYDNAILLDESGKVSEGPGACIFLVRDGIPITPPITSSILESITRATVIELLAKEFNLRTVEREVDRTELYVADEVFYCGTAWEITPVTSVDRLPVGDGKVGRITKDLQSCYFDVARGRNQAYGEWLTPVY